MNTTPQSNRLTVSIFGRCNAGKSALFNAITNTENAIVSDMPGTTTDPVSKSMELLPHGPIVLIDTAGLGDDSALGAARIKKTQSILNRTDLALYAIDAQAPALDDYRDFAQEFARRALPCLPLITKSDAVPAAALATLSAQVPDALPVSDRRPEELIRVKAEMSRRLDTLREDRPMLRDLLPAGAVVVMVVPVDSEAPRGRLILPQVQLIRECLDGGHRCHVTTEKELPQALRELKRVDLVVTDSQAFALVARTVPAEIPLTGFSILMARQKSDLSVLLAGAQAVSDLQDGDRVLIAETCTHNHSHEDIGRVKIPALLQKTTGRALHLDFAAGRDYPERLEDYALVIHCGGCMISRVEMMNRIRTARDKQVPITNYGLFLAHCHGILERSTAPLRAAGEVPLHV
ncbi:MAG: [FeFe] hydrogenase H-cluster maturation GTPase HydF [Oscillospiraceae bacterium]|jgi:[FeFe] hydrogenase H-cluster maturation GTPase HydF|nr:[FeFe] hydrogenase H-cluster maturation GTPase HydF [Oscillospiraceae bacterium]